MRLKLKECQGFQVRDYQYQDRYVTGDKVFYQHQNSSAWLGPAEVVYHRDNKVWIYVSGNLH